MLPVGSINTVGGQTLADITPTQVSGVGICSSINDSISQHMQKCQQVAHRSSNNQTERSATEKDLTSNNMIWCTADV